jgi:hypothetical protein
MSASNTNPPVPATNVVSREMWDDSTTDLNENRVRKNIPQLPKITEDIQVVQGGGIETIAFLILQVNKSSDRRVIMRAIASMCSVLLRDGFNFTGSPMKPVTLTGLEVAAVDDADPDKLITTNFEDETPVTISELLEMMTIDSDELGAYIGWMFYASQKQLTDLNMSAFNERRQSAATATLIENARIFINDSEYLDRTMAKKMYGSFLSFSPWRAHMIARIVTHLEDPLTGPALAFTNLFLLLVDTGMAALKIIKEAVMRHPWIRTTFPELQPDLSAANEAQKIIRMAPGRERSFLKAIHGNNFVPVNYSQIDNLTGVCKEILKRTVPSYQNYGGGKVTESQLNRINEKLGSHTQLAATVAAE